MDKQRLEIIKSIITSISFVNKLNNISKSDSSIIGNVDILFEELQSPIAFNFIIENEYPLKSYESDSIKFFNKDLVSYNHVMQHGNVCIHTSHNTNIEEKLLIDFTALKEWIIKYYINKNNDTNYEHIITHESQVNNHYYSFCFTECERKFSKDEIGLVNISFLNKGVYKESSILNFYIQSFETLARDITKCLWNQFYQNQKVFLRGLYCFLEHAPAEYGKFAYSLWSQIHLPSSLLNLLHEFEKQNLKKLKGVVTPLFIGYRTVQSEIHWQVALLEIGKFPIKGVPEKLNEKKTGRWTSTLIDEEINWGLTRNTSYKYFFGRGVFAKEITEKKILIIGVGAVGSIVAQTLTRCGCKFIDFIDHDIKEPENVCRSEYRFANGITNKVAELDKLLYEISPFLNSKPLNNNYFEKLIKSFYTDSEHRNKFISNLKNYDLIFDCSTDNDLMYVLDSLELQVELINISITNHANELVCAFHPNIYKFVNNQFSNVLKNDINDLYEPTGCWNPTFKASYNDINALVQLALKHINRLLNCKKARNNFVIKEIEEDLKIIVF